MPPKKEKAQPKEIIIDEYNITIMGLPQLRGFVYRLQEEVENARNALNFYVIEKDKIQCFGEISKNELEQKNNEIRLKSKDIEDISWQYEEKVTESNHKLKFIEYEKQHKMLTFSKESEEMHKEAKEKLVEEKTDNLHKLNEKRKQLQHLKVTYEDKVYDMNSKRNEFKRDMIRHREYKLKDSIHSYETLYGKLKEDLHLLKDVEVYEYEEQERLEHKEYIDIHIKSLEEMKGYFKGVIGGSLALVDALKTEIKLLKNAGHEMKENRRTIQQENESLHHVNKEARSCKIQLAHYEQDKKSNVFTEKRIKDYLERIKQLELENKRLSQKFDSLSKEKENMEVNFVSKLRFIEEGLRTKNTILQQKIDFLICVLEEKGEPISSLTLQPVDYRECYNVGSSYKV